MAKEVVLNFASKIILSVLKSHSFNIEDAHFSLEDVPYDFKS